MLLLLIRLVIITIPSYLEKYLLKPKTIDCAYIINHVFIIHRLLVNIAVSVLVQVAYACYLSCKVRSFNVSEINMLHKKCLLSFIDA